jgi:hypothetical protein
VFWALCITRRPGGHGDQLFHVHKRPGKRHAPVR